MSEAGPTTAPQRDAHTIDDVSSGDLVATNGARWRAVSDRVMGGVSRARLDVATYASVACLQLTGDVSLANNGGFIQAALELARDGVPLDASSFAGLRLRVAGNGAEYVAALRTPDCTRPWQSYRAAFVAAAEWRDVELPFAAFAPHRLTPTLDVTRLRRLGLLAIGREFHASLCVAGVWLYRSGT